MTQEERQLLFKDLCARLPYKPYLEWDDGRVIELNPISYETIARIYFQSEGNIIRPYLRSMSSMTEEEKEELRLYYRKGIDELKEKPSEERFMFGIYQDARSSDMLNSKFLDYRGLIPMGLAIEAPKDMYKLNK